ncbi:MAG: hypothetical protein AOA65_0664 [Candidatus Bathyarchaeota archaeon BA1]|nr:MAG: hypothetical protein AOA65_0664 [Candidatus Bathyarchaeota archaeon BA1]
MIKGKSFKKICFASETSLYDDVKNRLHAWIREPYYTAGKQYGWAGSPVGLRINECALEFAIKNRSSIQKVACMRQMQNVGGSSPWNMMPSRDMGQQPFTYRLKYEMEVVVPLCAKRVPKSKGRIWLPKTIRGGAKIYIPADIVLDSQFPFKEDGEILVEIDLEEGVLKLKPSSLKRAEGKCASSCKSESWAKLEDLRSWS